MSYNATTTLYTFLMVKEENVWNKVVDIKDYPDLLPNVSGVEVTTLSDPSRTFIPGLKDASDSMPFTANYDPTDVTRCKALEDRSAPKDYAIWFGGTAPAQAGGDPTPTGNLGKIELKAYLTVSLPGKGVNDPKEFGINLMPASDPTLTIS